MNKHFFHLATMLLVSICGETTFGSNNEHLSHLCEHRPQISETQGEAELILMHIIETHDVGDLMISRDEWPRDLPLHIEFGVTSRTLFETQESYWIEFADCHDLTVLRYFWMRTHISSDPFRSRSSSWHDGTISIPITCIDEDGIVRLAVRVRSADDDNVATEFVELKFSVDLVESADDILSSVHDEVITALLENTIVVRKIGGSGRDGTAHVLLRMPLHLPTDMAIALRFELIAGDDESNILGSAVLCTTRRYRRLQQSHLRQATHDSHPIRLELDADIDQLAEQAEGHVLRVRVTSDADLALRDLQNSKYWIGSLVTDIQSHENHRP